MEKKINSKIKKKLDNINKLKSEITSWKKLSEDDVLKLLKEFEKTPRDEGSSFYNDAFNDDEFAEVLLAIAKKYNSNTKINIFIISSLGNMMERYKLKETKSIYEYFLSKIYEKGVSVYASLFFTELKNFINYQNKWDYIMSVKDMKPSKIAESSFETIIQSKKNEIPEEYKVTVINHYLKKSENSNSESGKSYYLDLANEFK